MLTDWRALSRDNGLLTATADACGINRKHQDDDGKTVDKRIVDHWIGFDWIQELAPVLVLYTVCGVSQWRVMNLHHA